MSCNENCLLLNHSYLFKTQIMICIVCFCFSLSFHSVFRCYLNITQIGLQMFWINKLCISMLSYENEGNLRLHVLIYPEISIFQYFNMFKYITARLLWQAMWCPITQLLHRYLNWSNRAASWSSSKLCYLQVPMQVLQQSSCVGTPW